MVLNGMALRVGVDVGGTFTDFFFYDTSSGEVSVFKRPSTPSNQTMGIVSGLMEADIKFSSIDLMVISTTVATNALTTGNIPRIALITTKGFRDILEIRRGVREDIWDHYKDPAPPLVRRRNRFTVPERIDCNGAIVTPLDCVTLKKIAEIIKKREIDAVAIHFLNSYVNPAHEEQAESILKEYMPAAYMSRSSDVNAEIFEFERGSTTVVNVALMPVVSEFFKTINEALSQKGFRGGLLIVHSGGGCLTPTTAMKYPARLAGSGPSAGALGAMRMASGSASAGVIATAQIAARTGFSNVIGIDAGGTTTLVSLQYEGRVRMRKEWWINFGHPIRFQSPDVITIGAGGGSVAWLDEASGLHVGPQSMGADPGPACYGKGGSEPTLTDANVLTQRISPRMFLGGRIRIDPSLSKLSIQEKIAQRMGIAVMSAAEGIIKVAVNNMANAVGLISVSRGHDPRDFALVAFGGSGPLHATFVADELGVPNIIVPRWPGIVSAIGTQLMDVKLDLTKTCVAIANDANSRKFELVFEELERTMLYMLRKEGFSDDKVILMREIDMRYAGQWRSLTLSASRPLEGSISDMRAKFHLEHEREFNYRDESQEIEVYAVRVIGAGILEKPMLPQLKLSQSERAQPRNRRKVFLGENWIEFDIYERDSLGKGAELQGPAVVEQMDSTTLLLPSDEAVIDNYGNLIIKKHSS
jgi:N-methylhydantoinase A